MFSPQHELELKKKAEEAVAAEAEEAAAAYDPLTRRSLEELDEVGEGEEYADSRALEAYRQARIAQLKQTAERNKFGSVSIYRRKGVEGAPAATTRRARRALAPALQLLPLSRDDFVREVTEGSKAAWVVLLLYKDAVPDSKLVMPIFHRVRLWRVQGDTQVPLPPTTCGALRGGAARSQAPRDQVHGDRV